MPKTKSSAPGKGSEVRIRRKNLNIDQRKLDRVRRLLGTDTETEAVDLALDMVLFREELISGITRIAGTGGVDDVFAEDHEPA